MFESDNSRAILAHGMIRNFHMAEDAEARLGVEERYAAKLEKALRESRARVKELETDLAVQTAHADGIQAQALALIAEHPTTPLRRATDKRASDGSVKSHIRLLYEAAFDASLRKLAPQLGDPASRRAN